jgi:hypothetical protein
MSLLSSSARTLAGKPMLFLTPSEITSPHTASEITFCLTKYSQKCSHRIHTSIHNSTQQAFTEVFAKVPTKYAKEKSHEMWWGGNVLSLICSLHSESSHIRPSKSGHRGAKKLPNDTPGDTEPASKSGHRGAKKAPK